MSWQGYVDDQLVATGHVDKGALVSAAGDSVWAHSPGFEIKISELKAIVNIVSGDAKATSDAYVNGIHVAGSKYTLTKVEDKTAFARSGKTGLVIAKTKQAVIVAHYGENQIAGSTSTTVQHLADYLVGQGY
ncbi:Profilin [Cladobotryum mycophilum]|uniref:Profilin n=1 Tax=Cladobotryum mycophilum TaxID=491253 RepID=A0ABR0T1U8_9HYPO